MMSRRTYVMSALVLAAVLFVGMNIFVDNFFTETRIDLTQGGQFTLAPGTRAIIAKLPEPVTLKFYFSKKTASSFQSTTAYAQRVRDLLGQYAAISHGKILLEDVDPEPFTPEEDEAAAAGLTPAPTESGDVVYFGLSGTNRIDGKQTIAYFTPSREPYLEYDLTSLLYRLSTPDKPVLGLITSLPLENGGGQGAQSRRAMTLYSELAENYTINTLANGFAAIPRGIRTLLIVHPQGLGPQQLAAIDRFVLSGGRAVIFVDPMSELAQASGQGGAAPSSDLAPLLASWGVVYNSSSVVLDRALAQRVATGNDPRNPSLSYPLWLHMTADNFDHRDPITANLQSLNLASVGALAPAPHATTTFQPLIRSSDQAAILPRAQVMAIGSPDQLAAALPQAGRQFTLAARISGPAQSAFGTAKGDVHVVVVADSDLFDDRFWVHVGNELGRVSAENFADNGGLVLNAVENLSGSDDLISLRTRAESEHPFTVVHALQAEAEGKFRETAQSLQTRLTAAQQQLQQLQQGGIGSGAVALTPQQQAGIERLRREMMQTRTNLRAVQHNLRADIDTLGEILAFINIALVPLLVIAVAIILGFMRRGRARRRSAVATA